MPFPIVAALMGAQALGSIGSAFINDANRRAKFREYMQYLATQEQKDLAEGTTLIGQQVQGMVQRATAGAARRAMALGRKTDAEGNIAAAVAPVQAGGSQRLKEFVLGTQRTYAGLKTQAKMDELNAPPPINVGDILNIGASAATKYLQNDKMMTMSQEQLDSQKALYEAMGKYYSQGGTTRTPFPSTPAMLELGANVGDWNDYSWMMHGKKQTDAYSKLIFGGKK